MATRTENLQIKLSIDGNGNVTATLAGVSKSLDQVKQSSDAAKASAKGTATALAGLFTAQEIVNGAKWIVESIASSERLSLRLKTVAEDQREVNEAQAIARRIASESANSVDQVTEAYIALRERGLAPSENTMRSFANIAAATGKGVKEVAESIAAAIGGQTRGLQELGVGVEESNGRLIATFRGVREDIGTSAEDVIAYMVRIGETKYADAAVRESQTLSGEWGRLRQDVADLVDYMGENGLSEALSATVKWMRGEVAGIKNAFSETRKEFEAIAAALTWIAEKTPSITASFAAANEYLVRALAMVSANPALMTAVNASFAQRPEDFSSVTGGVVRPDFSSVTAGSTRDLGANTEAVSRNQLAKNGLAGTEGALTDAAARTIEQMKRQLMTLNEGQGASIRYAAAQAAAKATTKEQKDEILRLGDAIAKSVEGKKDDARAQREQNEIEKARREGIDRMRALLAAETAEQERLNKSRIDGATHTRAMIDAEERVANALADAYERVQSILDPSGDKVRELQGAYDDLRKAQADAAKAGTLSAEELAKQNRELDALADKIKKAAAEADRARGLLNLGEMLGDITGAGNAAGTLEGILGDVAETFTDLIKSGLQDAGESFGDLLGRIGDQLLRDVIQNKIVNNAAGAMGGGKINTQDLSNGLAYAGGTMIGTYAGGGGDRAGQGAAVGSAIGAVVGSFIPVIGTAIGAMLGGLLGGLVGGMMEKDPRAKVYSGGDSGSSHGGTSAFGRVQAYTYGLGGDASEQQLLAALMQLDNTIAKMLTPGEVEAVKKALEGQVFDAENADVALAARLNAIIAAVEPQWAAFLGKFEGLEAKGAAFAALRNLQDQLENFDNLLVSISGNGVAQIRSQLAAMDKQVTETGQALSDAIGSMDPVRIEQAASAAVQAVVDRYNTEIELAQQLEAALASAKQQAFQLRMTIEQRIASITGDSSTARDLAYGRIGDLMQSIPSASPGQALGSVNDLVGTIDQWRAAGGASITEWMNAQLAQLGQQRANLQAWAAQENARMQAAAAAANAAAQEARRREIEALQKQLQLAQQWVQVLHQADELTQALQFGESNPLGGFGQLEAMNQAIARLTGGASMEDLSADQANELLQLLQQRLQLIQSAGLYQRPSGDYLDQYNQTLAMIEQVRQLAQPGVDEATRLQEELIALQNKAIATYSAGAVDVTTQMQAISAQEEAIRKEAAEQQAKLDEESLKYYEWAKEEAQKLEDARQKELADQLAELTGGLPVQDFIAQKQAQATDLLTNIRDNLRDFLSAISNGASAGSGGSGGSGSGAGGGGGGGGSQASPNVPVPSPPPGGINMTVTINAAGLTQQEIVSVVHGELRTAASDIKRIIEVA